MNKFTIGIITGISSVAIAIPILAQLSSAASSSSATVHTKPVPSQACVQALAAKDAAELSTIDSQTAAHKAALQAHEAALTAAAAITDDTQRQAAIKKADADFAAALKAGMTSSQTAMQTALDGVKTACGNTMGRPGAFGIGGPMGKMNLKGNWHGKGPKGTHSSSATTSSL